MMILYKGKNLKTQIARLHLKVGHNLCFVRINDAETNKTPKDSTTTSD